MKTACGVIIFAKAPVPGYAKTRLARAIGPEAAARLAERMLEASVTCAVAAALGPVELCCAPDHSHPAFVRAAAEHGVVLASQGEGDLGARMHRALVRGLDRHDNVLLIGTDVPTLTPQHLMQAALLLRTQPAVFAPASDGGYVLVGLSRPMPELFDDIDWSTARVMAQTRDRLRRFDVLAEELPTLSDVDEVEDLQHVPPEWLA